MASHNSIMNGDKSCKFAFRFKTKHFMSSPFSHFLSHECNSYSIHPIQRGLLLMSGIFVCLEALHLIWHVKHIIADDCTRSIGSAANTNTDNISNTMLSNRKTAQRKRKESSKERLSSNYLKRVTNIEQLNKLLSQRLWLLLYKTITRAPRKPAGAITFTMSESLHITDWNNNNNNNNNNKRYYNSNVSSITTKEINDGTLDVASSLAIVSEKEKPLFSLHQTSASRLVLPTSNIFTFNNNNISNNFTIDESNNYQNLEEENMSLHWMMLYLLWTDQVRYSVNTNEIGSYLLKWAKEISNVNLHNISDVLYAHSLSEKQQQEEEEEQQEEEWHNSHKEILLRYSASFIEMDILYEFAELSLMWYLELIRQVYQSVVVYQDVKSCTNALDALHEYAPIFYSAFIQPLQIPEIINKKFKRENDMTKELNTLVNNDKTRNLFIACSPVECWVALSNVLRELQHRRQTLMRQSIKHLLNYIYVAAKVKHSSFYLFAVLSFMSSRINAFEPMMRARLTQLIQRLFSTMYSCKLTLHFNNNNNNSSSISINNNDAALECNNSLQESKSVTLQIIEQILIVSLSEIARMSLAKLFTNISNYLITFTAAWRRKAYKVKIYDALTHLPLSFYDLHGFDEVEQITYYVNDMEGVDVHLHVYVFNALHSLMAVRNSLRRLTHQGRMVVLTSVMCSTAIKYHDKLAGMLHRVGVQEIKHILEKWELLWLVRMWRKWRLHHYYHRYHRYRHHDLSSLETWCHKFVRDELKKSLPASFIITDAHDHNNNNYDHEESETNEDESQNESDSDSFNRQGGTMLHGMEIIASLPLLRPYGAEVTLMKEWTHENEMRNNEYSSHDTGKKWSASIFSPLSLVTKLVRQTLWRHVWMNELNGQFTRSLISSALRLLEGSCGVVAIAYGTTMTLCPTTVPNCNEVTVNETNRNNTRANGARQGSSQCPVAQSSALDCKHHTSKWKSLEECEESNNSSQSIFTASLIATRFSEAIYNAQAAISTIIDAQRVIELILLNAYKATVLQRLCNPANWEVSSIISNRSDSQVNMLTEEEEEEEEERQMLLALSNKPTLRLPNKSKLKLLPLSILFRSASLQRKIDNHSAEHYFPFAIRAIHLHHVQFAYPTAPTIPVFNKPLSFSINLFNMTKHQGKLIVIAGRSGCGKSTLLSLLLGLYDLPSTDKHNSKIHHRQNWPKDANTSDTKTNDNSIILNNNNNNSGNSNIISSNDIFSITAHKSVAYKAQEEEHHHQHHEELEESHSQSIELFLIHKASNNNNNNKETSRHNDTSTSNLTLIKQDYKQSSEEKEEPMYYCNLHHMPRQWIRGPLFGYVPQSPFIISGATIAHNVSLEAHITLASSNILDKVAQCIEWAECDEFVRKYPEGLLTRIASFANSTMVNNSEDVSMSYINNNNNDDANSYNDYSNDNNYTMYKRAGVVGLSGGQAQRLMLARALYQSQGVLLMDEPTANLDAKTKEQVIRTCKQLITHRQAEAVVCCSHDEMMLSAADEIIHLDEEELQKTP